MSSPARSGASFCDWEYALNPDSDRAEFERRLETRQPSVGEEFWHFLKDNKKWWLLPIVAALLLLGGLVVLSGSALAPFVYPL
jgi:hypothetical protein